MGHDPSMAPSDLSWHLAYELWLQRTNAGLDSLKKHPAFNDAEDLGDYVDCMTTLLSFAPRSRRDVQVAAKMKLNSED